jgi:hypothetical protein
MKNLSFYEQCGILIPGAVLLFITVALQQRLLPFFSNDGLTVGGLGLFLILAYGVGHAVAAVGNLIEALFWGLFGGMPSDWLTRKNARILTNDQRHRIPAIVTERLGISTRSPADMPLPEWRALFGQIYRYVLATNPGRIEVFNGNYGLSRGLAAASLCAAALISIVAPAHTPLLLGVFLVLAAVFLFRMYRFGVHFAREVLFCFLNPVPTALVKKILPSEGQ